LKILGPSQKTLRSPWCPKLVTGLVRSGTEFAGKLWGGQISCDMHVTAHINVSMT